MVIAISKLQPSIHMFNVHLIYSVIKFKVHFVFPKMYFNEVKKSGNALLAPPPNNFELHVMVQHLFM